MSRLETARGSGLGSRALRGWDLVRVRVRVGVRVRVSVRFRVRVTVRVTVRDFGLGLDQRVRPVETVSLGG